MLRWLWRMVWGKPEAPFFVRGRNGDGNNVVALPSGRLVFYIDMSDVPSDRAEAHLKKVKKDLGYSA